MLPLRGGQLALLYKRDIPNLSLVERFYCIRDIGPIPNLSLVERFYCIFPPREQFVVNLKGSGAESAGLSAIVPQMQVAGTVTRRAVESTWLTASNPKVCVLFS